MAFYDQVLIAIVLDLLIGDPTWYPHPVRIIGYFAIQLEKMYRALFLCPKIAGCFTFITLIIGASLITWLIVYTAYQLHHVAGDVVSIFIIYTSIAIHDLIKHSRRVYHALGQEDIDQAKRCVGCIVGRDTGQLDAAGITKATVETVSENLVDGIIAPLIYAILFGPVGVVVFKVISTTDSMFGYKNEKYKKFGWLSARSDDVVNFIPARITALLIPLAAFILRLDFKQSFLVMIRDRKNHASPNSAHSEAAVAGALGIQVGGENYYNGVLQTGQFIGNDSVQPSLSHILKANKIVMVTTLIFLFVMCFCKDSFFDDVIYSSLW